MMTRALKILGIVLAGMVVLIAGIAAFLSPKTHLERSVVVNTPASTIYAQVNSLKNAVKWMPWGLQDPEIQYNYEGPENGVGAKVSWQSKKLGNGSQWIIESAENTHIKTGFKFDDFEGEYSSDINLEPAEGGTKVTWTYDGDVSNAGMASSVMGKFMGMFMDSMMGKDYEKGLNNLKQLSESQPKEQTAPADSTQQKK